MRAVELNDTLVAQLEEAAQKRGQSLEGFISTLLTAYTNPQNVLDELRHFQRAVEQSPSAVVITDTEGRITYVNPKFTEVTGYASGEVLGHNPRILKSGHTSATDYAQLWDTITSGGEWYGEFLNRKKDGDLYWESASISPIYNSRDEITHFVAVKEDITRRKVAEAELRASEARYQALFDYTHDAIFLIDMDYNLMEVNQQAARVLGYSPEEMRGRPMTDFLMPDERSKSLQQAAQIRAGTAIPLYERRFQHRNGHEIVTEISAALVVGEHGQPSHFQSSVRDITERKQMEEALRASEARFRAIVNTIPDLILRVRADHHIFEYIDPNNRTSLAPLPRAIPIHDLLSAQSAEQLIAAVDQALSSRDPLVCEYCVKNEDGPEAHKEARVVADSPDSVFVMIRDITDSKRIQAALQQSEQAAWEFQDCLKRLHNVHMQLARTETLDELLQKTVTLGQQQLGYDRIGLMLFAEDDQALVGTYGTDKDGNLRDERDYYCRVSEKESWIQDLLVGREYVTLWEDVRLNDYDQHAGWGWNAVAALWDGRQTLGCIVADNLLHHRPVRAFETDLLSLYGSTIGHLIARKRAEETLRASENRFRTLLEAAPLGVFLIDPSGKIVSSNHKAENLFGYTRHEMESHMLEDLLPVADRSQHMQHRASFFENPRQRLMGIGLDLYGVHKNGTSFPVEVALSYIPLENQMLALAFVADVAERKAFERQQLELILERERTNILAKFIQDAAHEFRTPLSIINTNLYLMRRSVESDRLTEICCRIQGQADSLTELIDTMTTMMRLDSRNLTQSVSVNINTSLRAVIAQMQAAFTEKKLHMQTNLMSQVALVRGDAGDLAMAFTCLLDNAIRYTPEGGTISITSEITAQEVLITLQDTGIGMNTDVVERIFERFYRADEAHSTRGFGLGLPIARHVIEQHEGSIAVESTPGVGTIFRILFPLSSPV